MADVPLFATAAEICAHLPIDDRALALLQGDPTPDTFLQVLVEKRMYVDAIRFLGLALPSRKAVCGGVSASASPQARCLPRAGGSGCRRALGARTDEGAGPTGQGDRQ